MSETFKRKLVDCMKNKCCVIGDEYGVQVNCDNCIGKAEAIREWAYEQAKECVPKMNNLKHIDLSHFREEEIYQKAVNDLTDIVEQNLKNKFNEELK